MIRPKLSSYKFMHLVLTNTLITLLLLASIEAFVRLAVPEIRPAGTDRHLFADSMFADVPGPRPSATGRSNGALFRVSPNGFWHYNSNRSPPPSWMFLGDSVTMGIGVRPDSTYAGRMAAELDDIYILNPSLIGYSSRDYRDIFEVLMDSSYTSQVLDIERVTVFWCLNDVYGAVPVLNDPGSSIRKLGGRILSFVQRYIYTYHALKALLFDRPRSYFEHDSALYTSEAVAAAVGDLNRVQDIANSHGVLLDVVLLPYVYQLLVNENHVYFPQIEMKAQLNAAGITVHDPAPYLLAHAEDPRDLFLFGDGIHLSSEGHRRIKEFIMAHIGHK